MAYAAATSTTDHTLPDKSSALPPAEFDLAVEGMTCASCVGRVEKALKRVPGVTDAAVNLATERAHVTGHGIDAETLVAAVDRTGFHASPIVEDQSALAGSAAADEAAVRQRRELVQCADRGGTLAAAGGGDDRRSDGLARHAAGAGCNWRWRLPCSSGWAGASTSPRSRRCAREPATWTCWSRIGTSAAWGLSTLSAADRPSGPRRRTSIMRRRRS